MKLSQIIYPSLPEFEIIIQKVQNIASYIIII